ncbi:MAG: hypothetical protein AABY86_01390 [Bdellovibrionota bacterium]
MHENSSNFLHSGRPIGMVPSPEEEGGDRRKMIINDKAFQIRYWIGFQIGAAIVLASSWCVHSFFGLGLWATGIAFLVSGSGVSFFLSRQISGPLYRLRLHMEDFAHGRPRKMHSRKNDSFQQLIQVYNQQVDFVSDLKASRPSNTENVIPLKKAS